MHRYWKDRLDSVPLPLDEAEVKKMLEWLPHLGVLFPEGVALAITTAEPTRLENAHFLYEMRESDLVTRFPSATAEFLIYLCSLTSGTTPITRA